MKKDKKLILLVEDDSFLQSLYNDLLNGEGYNVTVSQDGAEALKLIQEKNWDLILLDIMIPLLNGIELCKKLRTSNINTPIIMLTAKDSIEDKIMGLDIGANDYLAKPLQHSALVSMIKAWIK